MITRRILLTGSASLGLFSPAWSGEQPDYRFVQSFVLGDEEVKDPITLVARGYGPGPAIYAPHEDESTSIKAVLPFVKEYGGTLVEVKQSGARTVTFRHEGKNYTFDPNRIFTDAGIKATLKRYGSYSKDAHRIIKQKFACEILASLGCDTDAQRYPVIAIHNNTNGNYSLASYEEGGEYANDAEEVFSGGGDKDNFFFVTYADIFKQLAAEGQSAVLQNNEQVTDDGSLSVYCARRGVPYVNVEAQDGKEKDQSRMLAVLFAIIMKKQ